MCCCIDSTCCSLPVYTNGDIQVSRGDLTFLIVSLACVILGILIVAGVLPYGGPNGAILPGVNFGAAIEGGIAIGLGALVLPFILGRIFSPSFRNCLDPEKPTPEKPTDPN